MIRLENIKASYSEFSVLEGINFHVSEGEFLGIIGPNGAGKTTLLKVMTGVKRALNGKIMLDDKDISSLSRKEIAKIMAVVPQSIFIPPLFTVEDVVLMGRYAHQENRFGVTKQDLAVCEEAMRKTDTIGFRHRQINELSGGERQAVIIARALAQEPKILMLDEPTANLDIKHQMRVLGLVKTLVREHGITTVMVIHDLNLAARFCDRLILLHNHRILCDGISQQVLTPKNLLEAYEVEVNVEYSEILQTLQVMVKGIMNYE
ncbi:ABC transporter ATP-binding protein [bacterium]|nr:ABC transporter ATP-binding protein [bacterium]